MIRTVLTDVQWETMSPYCHGKMDDPGRSGGDKPFVCGSCSMEGADQQPMAGSAEGIRQLEYGLQACLRRVEQGNHCSLQRLNARFRVT
jgi:hypothetical protein